MWIEDNELYLESDADSPVVGDDVTFSIGGTIPANATIEWDANYNGTSFQATPSANSSELTTSFASAGNHTVAARVMTSAGPAPVFTLSVSVGSAPGTGTAAPDVTAPADLTVTAGDTRTLSVAATSTLGVASVQWWVSYEGEDYEQDTSLTTLAPTYHFIDYGGYGFWVIVTDTSGQTGECSFHVTAENAPPDGGVSYKNAAGQASGPVAEGSDAYITVTGLAEEMDVENIDDLSVWVDWLGTGEFDLVQQGSFDGYEWVYDASTTSLSFKGYYDDNGTYNTVIHLEDDWGATATYTLSVSVVNVDPTATVKAGIHVATMANSGQEVWTIYAGQNVELVASDPSEADDESLAYFWSFDGSAYRQDTEAVPLPSYAPGKIYNVSAYVVDKKLSQNWSCGRVGGLLG